MSEASAEANEADVLEQQTPAVADDADTVDEELAGATGPEPSPIEANEADVAEQRLAVPADDEDGYAD